MLFSTAVHFCSLWTDHPFQASYGEVSYRTQLPGSHHSLVRAPHNQRIQYRRFQTFHFSALPLQWDGVYPGKFLDRAEYRIPDKQALGWPGEIFGAYV